MSCHWTIGEHFFVETPGTASGRARPARLACTLVLSPWWMVDPGRIELPASPMRTERSPAELRARTGGPSEVRTRRLRAASAALSQMSYRPVVPGARIEQASSDFQSDVSTTITIQANWSGRRVPIPRPRPWQGRALPLSYVRMVGVAWNRTCTAQRRRVTAGWVSQFPTHPNCASALRRSPALPDHPRSTRIGAFPGKVDLKGVHARLRGLWVFRKEMRQTYETKALPDRRPCCRLGQSYREVLWRKADVSIATPVGAPTAFEAGPEAAPDNLPDLAEAGAHDAHTLRCQPLSKRCRTPVRFSFHGGAPRS